VLNVTVNLVRLIAVLCEPYMPATARRIVAQLNLPDLGPLPDRFELTLQAGHRIGTPEVLVRKIEDKEIEALKARFGYQPLRLSVYSLFFFFFFCFVLPTLWPVLTAFVSSAPKETFPLDIRVGQILSAQNHPSAERLYTLLSFSLISVSSA
jgi:tRNA-binding EMAP/Myf-like protein